MQLPISVETYQQLISASTATAFQLEDWEIGAIAIKKWLVRHEPDSFNLPATKGFQWKCLFLPEGTLLRTIFNGKNYHCRVEDDHILYNGTPISPSGFVNAVGGVRRNAWKAVWLLFPRSETWKLAATLRVESAT